MNTPKQEIEITEQELKELTARLTNFLYDYWHRNSLVEPVQIDAAADVKAAIDVVFAKLKILKEKMQ
jgi:hypothetical protein